MIFSDKKKIDLAPLFSTSNFCIILKKLQILHVPKGNNQIFVSCGKTFLAKGEKKDTSFKS